MRLDPPESTPSKRKGGTCRPSTTVRRRRRPAADVPRSPPGRRPARGQAACAIAMAAQDAGAPVVAAGRDAGALAAAYAGEPGISTETVDLTDEASIAALGERLGTLDHVVSTASARARGRVPDLDRDAIRLSFDTKVTGPLMLAKHLAPRMSTSGSFVIFSGVAAAKIAVGTLGEQGKADYFADISARN